MLRLTQEWTRRGTRHVLALRLTESLGVDVLDITDDGSERDGEFFTLLGQAQFLRKLGETDNQVVLRGSMQWSDDALLSLEQFSVGGMNSVRGYRENQLVRDIGYLASLEFHYPLFPRSEQGAILTFVPFVDAGGGRNHDLPGGFEGSSDENKTIASAGIGLILRPTKNISAELYWGHGFTDFEDSDDSNLQDDGLHFRVSAREF